jgi:hypothetical protein
VVDLSTLAERAMSMDEETWQRHANPWSFWTRFATGSTSLTLAAWSRIWIGPWFLLPLGLALVWLWYNPRAFGVPERTDRWSSKAVFGERIYNERRDAVPDHHRTAARILTGLSAAASVAWIYGLVVLHPWWTALGLTVSMLGKTWFVDRMAWVYEDMKHLDPRYRDWVRTGEE